MIGEEGGGGKVNAFDVDVLVVVELVDMITAGTLLFPFIPTYDVEPEEECLDINGACG